MRVREVAERIGLDVRAGRGGIEREVRGGYASDLLSDVMAGAREGDLWVTLQGHQNVVAVAAMAQLAGIVLIGGREPAENAIEKAENEGIPILTTPRTTFETVAGLHDLGIRGGRR